MALDFRWSSTRYFDGEVAEFHTCNYVTRLMEQLRAQYGNRSWTEILAEIREAFANPAVEASEVLGVARSATAAEVRKAHRDLARQNHPDKVGGSPEAQAAAEEKMQKLNWAKEVLLSLKDSD